MSYSCGVADILRPAATLADDSTDATMTGQAKLLALFRACRFQQVADDVGRVFAMMLARIRAVICGLFIKPSANALRHADARLIGAPGHLDPSFGPVSQ